MAAATANQVDSYPSQVRHPSCPPSMLDMCQTRCQNFWLKDLGFWFAQTDPFSCSANIARSLKMSDRCLVKLPAEVITIRELVGQGLTGTIEDPYERLEAKREASFQKRPWQLTLELLDRTNLSDGRPTFLMDCMLALLPANVAHNKLSSSWLFSGAVCQRTEGAAGVLREMQTNSFCSSPPVTN
jgi:hypothetical protein